MFRYTLLGSSGVALAEAGIYAFVGKQLGGRHFEDPGVRTAHMLFVVWWFALAASTLLGGVGGFLGALGWTDLNLHVTLTHMNLLAICLALWGLLYYLAYLFSGSRMLLAPLTLFYLLYYAFLVYFITASEPIGVSVGPWRTSLEYANQMEGPLFVTALVLLVFPQIIAGLAYFSLFFRVDNRTQKYRILLVSWSIIIWFGVAFLASLGGLTAHFWWQIISQFIGLAAALTILMAYYPLGWIRRRYDIASIADEGARPARQDSR